MARHEIMNGKVHLYKRENSSYWQADTRVGGQRFRMTTKEDSIERAKDLAEDWYLGLRGKLRNGELPPKPEKGAGGAAKKQDKGKLFSDAAAQFLLEYGMITQGHRSPRWIKIIGEKIRLHLNPFFGPLGLTEITSGKVQEYRMHRATKKEAEPPKEGKAPKEWKPPARSTIHHEIVTLRQVLKTGMRHGWLHAMPDLSLPYKSAGKISHRAWFSPDEYKKLYEATRERAKEPKTKRWAWTSEQMHDYVLFMANTGLRPDEARRLEFRDVEVVKDDATKETILEIEVRGKRGVGYCKSTSGAVKPFLRLKERLRAVPVDPKKRGKAAAPDASGNSVTEQMKAPGPTDLVFPGEHRELFNKLLDELKLKFDRDGNRRTAYSLRHTYICLRLMEGADIYAIAKNCRTSVEMIEKFYASHIKNTLDASAINVMRPRKGKKPPPMHVDT